MTTFARLRAKVWPARLAKYEKMVEELLYLLVFVWSRGTETERAEIPPVE